MTMQTTLRIDDEEYLADYKVLGYPTKAALVNEALLDHKKKKKRELREKRRQAMINTWKPTENLLEDIEGEDFE